jgi:hypothetical protein
MYVTTFEMSLNDTPGNREKSKLMGALEIMFDDSDNELPKDWNEKFNGDAGTDVPWGTKFKITIERVE